MEFHVVVVPDAGFPLWFLSISIAALSGLEAGRAPRKNFTGEGETILGISLARPGRNGR
jgi:hypothetical protein